MDKVSGGVRSGGGISNSGSVYLINHNADNALVTLRYRLKDVEMDAAEEPFEAAGRKFNRGSFIIRKAPEAELKQIATELGIQVYAVADAPSVKTHPIRAPRIAMMHTWLTTQDEGWYRVGLDQLPSSICLHQHAGCFEGYKSQQQVRRDSVCSSRSRCSGDHQRLADVRKSDSVEEHSADAESCGRTR